MTFLIVGDGLIGSAVKTLLPDAAVTSRRVRDGSRIFLDLLNPPDELPQVEVAYLCAGINGIRENEGNPKAWRTNVDGVIKVISLLPEAFIVYLSTGAVEWSDTSYARQRAMVECGLQFRGRCAIVRPQKVTKDNVEAFAQYVVRLGERRKTGIYQGPC